MVTEGLRQLLLANPARVNETRLSTGMHPPLPGEHLNEVLRGELGYADIKIEPLRSLTVV